MRLWLTSLVIAFVFLLNTPAAPLFAQASAPVGSCAPGFHLHEVHDEAEHEHKHVGVETDKNDDGWICVKHVGKDDKIHVHVDNNLPL